MGNEEWTAFVASLDRGELTDKGAGVLVGIIRQIRRQAPGHRVEVLLPDFQGRDHRVRRVVVERPDVFNCNVEVVPRLYAVARRGSTWERSRGVLKSAKAIGGDEAVTNSGLMVGLGQSFAEVMDALGKLRENQVQAIAIDQRRDGRRDARARPAALGGLPKIVSTPTLMPSAGWHAHVARAHGRTLPRGGTELDAAGLGRRLHRDPRRQFGGWARAVDRNVLPRAGTRRFRPRAGAILTSVAPARRAFFNSGRQR
jgi:hypothetical protein